MSDICLPDDDAELDRIVLVLTTWPADRDAAPLARSLVETRAAGCVALLPEMRSIYLWQGEVHDDAERQLVIKTTARRVAAVRDLISRSHPYEVPEFLVLDVAASTAPYAAWLKGCVAGDA